MTPEEHFERGLKTLAYAEQSRAEGRLAEAQVDSVMAGAYFQAAAAGAGIRALTTMTEPQPVATPGPPEATDG